MATSLAAARLAALLGTAAIGGGATRLLTTACGRSAAAVNPEHTIQKLETEALAAQAHCDKQRS
jgi:hypothetical protein